MLYETVWIVLYISFNNAHKYCITAIICYYFVYYTVSFFPHSSPMMIPSFKVVGRSCKLQFDMPKVVIVY